MRGALARLGFILRAAARGLRASAATASVAIVAIALSLVLGGAFGLVITNMRAWVERVGDELTLSAWLSPAVDDPARAALAAAAARIEGVGSVEALSPSDALTRFPERTGVSAGLLEGLDDNPLPASLEVRLVASSRTTEAVRRVTLALQSMPGVEDVSSGDDWLDGYRRALFAVRSIGLAVGSVLALATLVIVASTIRLALRARRDELEILSLVGASRTTLRAPFLVEGVVQGALAGGLALLLLRALFALARPGIDAGIGFLAGPGAMAFLSPLEMVLLVSTGALLGGLGAAFSLAAEARA